MLRITFFTFYYNLRVIGLLNPLAPKVDIIRNLRKTLDWIAFLIVNLKDFFEKLEENLKFSIVMRMKGFFNDIIIY